MAGDLVNEASSIIGLIIAAGGGGAVVGYLVFQFLGKSWIQNQLSKDLERAKSDIALISARRMKLHDREYVVFPEAWGRLNAAVASLGRAVSSMREVPDFARMPTSDIQIWLEKSDLSDSEKSTFNSSADKSSAYVRILDFRDILQANNDFWSFHDYLMNNRIFLSPDIKEKFDAIDDVLRDSWVSRKMHFDGHRTEEGKGYLMEALQTYRNKVKPLMQEIEALVQAKIFPDE